MYQPYQVVMLKIHNKIFYEFTGVSNIKVLFYKDPFYRDGFLQYQEQNFLWN